MLKSLLAWNTHGDIVAALDYAVARDADGKVTGIIDFAAHEDAGGRMRDIWDVQQLDAAIPPGVVEQALGRKPTPREQVTLPPDNPFRLAHETVAGSGTWPEWLGSGAYAFKAEIASGKITALVHKESGYRRDRATIESAISERIAQANGKPADLRDLVGGPDRPLLLDEAGKTRPRSSTSPSPNLPVVRRGTG